LNVPVTYRRFINGEHIGKFVEIEIVASQQNGESTEAFHLHYYEQGDGHPVILIHGIGQSLYTWRYNINAIASAGYRVIALDLPGFGYSDKPDINYGICDMSAAIEAFVHALKIDKADFVAFSTGCLYLLDFLYNNPEHAGRVTLVSPGIPNDGYPPLIKHINSFMSRMGLFNISESYVSKVLDTCFFDKTFITKDVIREYFKPYKNKFTKQALMQSLLNYDFAKYMHKLNDIGKLCLILWSSNDKYNSSEIVELFHAPIRTAHLYTIRNCGHLLHEEKHLRFNEIQIDFLNWRRKKNPDR
jgi:pimeloyl-ACP methyl ester carboxylesterase